MMNKKMMKENRRNMESETEKRKEDNQKRSKYFEEIKIFFIRNETEL